MFKLLLSPLLSVLLILLPRLAFAAESVNPFPQAGRYAGTITIIEKAPLVDFTGVPAGASPREFILQQSSARLVASVAGNKIRLLGPSGSSFLDLLDEPAFASIRLPLVDGEHGPVLAATAVARKQSGFVMTKQNKIVLTYEFKSPHTDFVSSDLEVLSDVTIRIVLSRIGS